MLLCLGLVAGCALKGDVRKVELQVQALRAEAARADSARMRDRDSLLVLLAGLERAAAAQQQALGTLRGELRTELHNVKQELALLQELTGQSQQRLSDLRRRIEAQPPPSAPADSARTGTTAPVGPSGNPAGPTADQMYDVSYQQFRRGSLSTARVGFEEMLRVYPSHERAPDALFYIGETLARDNPDSAATVYQLVVQRYASSTRAPGALYKLGLLAEQRGDRPAARQYFQRLVQSYPRSDEANLAREKLRAGP